MKFIKNLIIFNYFVLVCATRFSFLSMTNTWLQPPKKIINFFPINFKFKYVDAIKFEPTSKLLGIGTSDGYTAMYKISDKKQSYYPLWINKPFDKKEPIKHVDILPKYFIVRSVFENTKIFNSKNKLIFKKKWNDTTAYETIKNDFYYRFNYFGKVSIYNITSKQFVKNHTFTLNSYSRIIEFCDDKIFIITDSNIIYMFDMNFNKLIEFDCNQIGSTDINQMFEKKKSEDLQLILPRTAIIKRIGNQYFILIGFHSGHICSVSFLINTIEKDDTYEVKYQLKNLLITKHPISIVKFIISSNLFFVFDSECNLTCYKLNTLTPNNPLEILYSIHIDAQYTTTIEYSNNYIFMNGFKGIKILDFSERSNILDIDDEDNAIPIV